MLKKERQQIILNRVNKQGRVTTNEMVEEFGCAVDTIRKDFQEMGKAGIVKRVHGGVLRIEKELLDFKDRMTEKVHVKQILAEKATTLLKDQSIIYIDGGTTNLKFAESLPKDLQTMVVTNSPAIALALCDFPGIEITVLAGQMQKTTRLIEGSNTLQQIENMHFQIAVIGVSSISAESGITYPSMEEAMLKKAAFEHAQQVIIIANKEKIGSVAGFQAADISTVTFLVTDETNETILAPYRKAGIEIIISETSLPDNTQ